MKPKLNSTIFLLFTLFSSAFCQSQTNENIDPKAYSLKKEAKFEENKGQVTGLDSKQVKFIYQQDNLSLFLLNNGISYQFNKTHPLTEKSKELSMETYRMDLVLVNSNLNTEILKEGKSISMDNYYNHNALDVHTYTKITYLNVYPNIDWVIYKTNSNVKYDFIVHPGGNVNSIKLQTKWVKELKLNADGSVILQGDEHYIKEDKPVSYQGVEIIDTKFKLNKGVLSFDVSNYDITKTLIIDPTLTWATYYGGTNKDIAESCVTDKQGNVYMSGSTWSNNYIASGGHQNSYSANADAFLVKFNNQGVRQWATYYGGAGVEEGLSCSVDNIGNVCLAGNTKSTANISFNGHQNTHGGSATGDAFLVKFNSQGIRQWATYYGGSNNDFANSCAMNALGEIYILGETSSTNNIAFNGYQITYFTGASNMAFLAKFNANGTREWASYFGTNGGTTGKSCAIDNLGKVYISGHTYSTSNFAFNGHQNTIGSLSYTDAYLAKLNESGSLVWSTYYGGSQDDKAYSCSVDINGNVFLAGSTASNTNIAFNGYMNSLNAGYNTFLVKFNSSGTRLWGTYYGGSSAVCSTDKFGNVYLAGNAPSLNGIALWGIQNINGGLIDAYLVKFNASGSRKWGYLLWRYRNRSCISMCNRYFGECFFSRNNAIVFRYCYKWISKYLWWQ